MIDAHCHLADGRIYVDVDEIISRSSAKGISGFIQGGVGPDDWRKQQELKSRFPDKILTCFGLHPYWISEHSHGECSEALLDLDYIIEQTDFLGELGLDFREKIVGHRKDQQIFFFEKQLDLVKTHSKIAVFHFVRCHDESVEILKKYTLPRGGLVHAFNSNYDIAKKYLDLGLMISVGGPLLRENNHTLQDAVKKIPLERLLLESDSPDQAPPSRGKNYNEPWTVLEVAAKVADLHGISYELVISTIKRNSLLAGHNLGR